MLVDLVTLLIESPRHLKISELLINEAARLDAAERALPVVRRAILECDFEAFGEETEQEALRMHAVALTSQPSVLYWSPETVRIMQAIRAWRAAVPAE